MSRALTRFHGIWKKSDVTVPASGSWSTPAKVDVIGRCGRITRVVVRAPASSTWTAGELRIWGGTGYTTSTDPATVPDEDLVVEITGATITGSATDADIDENLDYNQGGAVFDIRDYDADLWFSAKSTAGTEQQNVVVAITAEDCNGA